MILYKIGIKYWSIFCYKNVIFCVFENGGLFLEFRNFATIDLASLPKIIFNLALRFSLSFFLFFFPFLIYLLLFIIIIIIYLLTRQ